MAGSPMSFDDWAAAYDAAQPTLSRTMADGLLGGGGDQGGGQGQGGGGGGWGPSGYTGAWGSSESGGQGTWGTGATRAQVGRGVGYTTADHAADRQRLQQKAAMEAQQAEQMYGHNNTGLRDQLRQVIAGVPVTGAAMQWVSPQPDETGRVGEAGKQAYASMVYGGTDAASGALRGMLNALEEGIPGASTAPTYGRSIPGQVQIAPPGQWGSVTQLAPGEAARRAYLARIGSQPAYTTPFVGAAAREAQRQAAVAAGLAQSANDASQVLPAAGWPTASQILRQQLLNSARWGQGGAQVHP